MTRRDALIRIIDALHAEIAALKANDVRALERATADKLGGIDALATLGTTSRQLFGIAVAPVPEPATWAMMILGFGAVGYSLRRRTARVRVTQLV